MQGLSAEFQRGSIPQDTILKFRKGEIIFSQGDPGDCWFEVISGTVRTCHFHVDGHRQLTGFFYQGDVFGVEYGARDAAAARGGRRPRRRAACARRA